MVNIMTGKIKSRHHEVFHSGSRKERAKLKLGNKYGPIKEWPAKKVSELTSFNLDIIML